MTVKILTPAEWTLTASWFVFNIMFLWPYYLFHRMKNKTVEIPSSLMWWVFGVHEVTQQKNQLVGNLGWDKQRFGQTLIHGLTTFAHKLSIPPWTVIFSVHQKSPFSAEKVTLRCYKCVTTSLYASLILLKLPSK